MSGFTSHVNLQNNAGYKLNKKKIKILRVATDLTLAFCIPIMAMLFFIKKMLGEYLFNLPIPTDELVALSFAVILIFNSSSFIEQIIHVRHVPVSRSFNYWHWIYVILRIANCMIALIIFLFISLFTIEMIYYEAKFGTIFVANSYWKYSLLGKLLLISWIIINCFYSAKVLKNSLLPFSKKK
ncbi:MAG: hypothetical protein CBD16_03945 [Betaproteobacteria bacterium TMED156]|nr:MAG: hypothetical protein CBD16_03945 [Betaproteobacteria bacterium TMED156]|tara:strand:- start:1009 stop:1557 length:549 start_codon:yes stop_codon:yes gene_type:complete